MGFLDFFPSVNFVFVFLLVLYLLTLLKVFLILGVSLGTWNLS